MTISDKTFDTLVQAFGDEYDARSRKKSARTSASCILKMESKEDASPGPLLKTLNENNFTTIMFVMELALIRKKVKDVTNDESEDDDDEDDEEVIEE